MRMQDRILEGWGPQFQPCGSGPMQILRQGDNPGGIFQRKSWGAGRLVERKAQRLGFRFSAGTLAPTRSVPLTSNCRKAIDESTVNC
jgi:hypothetical protein